MKATADVEILRIKGAERETLTDIVVREYHLRIHINGQRYIDLLCSPLELEALVYGHLLSEGIIHTLSDVLSVQIREDDAFVELRDRSFFQNDGILPVRTISTGCGRPHSLRIAQDAHLTPVPDGAFFPLTTIQAQVSAFEENSELFISTGGVHSCALYTGGQSYFMEDIGRHNALDKVLGRAFLDGADLSSCYLITSGRIPSDMILKLINAALPLVISRAAPTDAAVMLARQYHVTLCGFARGTRMNVYSMPSRLV